MQYGRIRRGMQGEEQLYVNGRSEDCQPVKRVLVPRRREAASKDGSRQD
jgi:hypothetical protein